MNFLICLILISTTTFAAPDKVVISSKSYDLSKQESQVEFWAVGRPSLLKINGTGGKLTGKVDFNGSQGSGEFIVPLEPITTGISLRDDHMKKKYLEIEKFPTAVLKITEIKFEKDFLKENGTQKNIPFKGKLTIHGNESDVLGFADMESTDQLISIQAKTKTNITDYKMDILSYLGIKVADEVEIRVDLKIIK